MMNTDRDPSSLRSAREATIDHLCRGFAEDALELGELERRLEKARGARTREELSALVADLKLAAVVAETKRSEEPGPLSGERRPRSPRSSPFPAPEPAPPVSTRAKVPARGPDEARPFRHLALAVLGGTRRAGKWAPPSNILAMALMGGVELDFREAVLSDGDVTDINCFAFWGGIDITVPPGVNVETNGFALMGGFDQTTEIESRAGPGAPTIRVNGFALMGGIDVRVAERGQKLPKKDW